jgi:hypothetical protein
LLESNAGDWGRDVRVLLVGNKADQARDRDVLEKHCREVAEEHGLYSYVEVCSLEGESHGVPLVQQLLAELTGLDVPMEQLRKTIADPIRSRRLPAAAARLFNRNSGKKSDDKKSRSVSPPPRRPYERATSWLYDPTEGIPEAVAGVQDSSMPSGDVKLRAISKAIYDIRGAGAEKCKAIAKYREREVSQWLSRSRYFGPTESSRHKRWQEDQKRKKQQQQQLVMQQQQQQRLKQRLDSTAAAAAALQPPLLERRRSLSHPGKFQSPHGLVGTSSGSCSDLSDSNEEATVPLAIDGKRSCEPKTPAAAQMEIQLEGELEAQRLRKAAKRAMRKKIRAASGDMYERHSSSWFNTPPPRLEALAPPMWSAHQRRPAAPTHLEAAGSRWPLSASPSLSSRRTLSNASRPRSISPARSPSSSAEGSSPSRPSSKSISPDRPRLAVSPPASLKRSLRRGSEASLGGMTTQDIVRVAVPLTPSSLSSASNNDLKTGDSPAKDQRADKAAEENCMSNGVSAPAPDMGPTVLVPPHPEAKQAAAPIPCGSSTTSEELDCTDIDEMLDYFDNVTLQL